tara:strand:+ start:113 stop:274 length:162 start_codon:yes stop_codon:yes gene_type:complete
MTKTDLIRVVRESAKGTKLTRDQKQQVFNDVVDGLLKDGRITKKQQQAWTHPF